MQLNIPILKATFLLDVPLNNHKRLTQWQKAQGEEEQRQKTKWS